MPTVYTPAVPTYVALATTTLAGTDAAVTFSSIPAGYRDLVLVAQMVCSSDSTLYVKLNGDGTTGNYLGVYMRAYDPSSYNSANLTNNFGYIRNGNTNIMTLSLMDYSATDKHKTFLIRDQFMSPGEQTAAKAGRWVNTAAVTSLELNVNTNFTAGSTFSLYGIEA